MIKAVTLVAKLSTAQDQLRALQGEAAALVDGERFGAELESLQSRLVELEVAYQELEEQNDKLLAAREELENQRHRYLRLFNEAPFGYLVTDLHGVIDEGNHWASHLLGVVQPHLEGKPILVYLLPQDRATIRDLISQARTGELPGELEVRIKPRRGPPFAAMVTVVRDLEGRTGKLRWAIRDVSQTKAMEEALRLSEERLRHAQRMEAIGRLAGGIAHSFNNLLAAIAFQCELLCDRLEEGDDRRAQVTEIQKAEERAAALARQLLAFGRKQTLQPRVIRLNDLVQEMEPMLRRLIGEDIDLETRLDSAAGAVHVDLGQLEQVVLNLIVNARDAMPSGGTVELITASVEIAAGETPGEGPGDRLPDIELPPGPYVQLAIADSGPGIPPEVREHLFEPFFTTKERGKGTGLGLATVHGIVHQSGGAIRVDSEPGQGACFTILLPQAAEAPEPLHPLPLRSTRRSRRGSEVVLLVEDENNIREPASRSWRAGATRCSPPATPPRRSLSPRGTRGPSTS